MSHHKDHVNDSSMRPAKHQTIRLHHTAIRTRNIETAIQFYSLFGFQVEARFRSGPAKCCWLTLSTTHSDSGTAKLELIEIPPFILKEDVGTRKRALDVFRNEQMLGLNHLALDVTDTIEHVLGPVDPFHTSTDPKDPFGVRSYGLREYLVHVNQTSVEKFGKGLRVALEPKQQIIGRLVFELAFIYDADGAVLELLNCIKVLDQEVDSGWEPWRGTL
jgi:catechol 2,3-dioxygenase-like lactoylglutathione lyase family enzyme